MPGFLETLWQKVRTGAITAGQAISDYWTNFKEGVEEKGFLQWGIVEPFMHAMGLLSDGIDKAAKGIAPKTMQAFEDLSTGEPNKKLHQGLMTMLDNIGKGLGLSPDDIKIFKSGILVPSESSVWIQLIFIVYTFLNMAGLYRDLNKTRLMRKLFSIYRPSIPGSGEVMGARGLSLERDKKIWEILRQNGYRDDDIETMFAATYSRIPEAQLREVYFREAKSKEWAFHRLAELGYTPERSEEIFSLWAVIPTIQDLIMMMGREAFEPDMIKRYGLDELYPGELTAWAQKQGLSEEWAKKYWYAHWEHPGLQTVLEMFHRGQVDEAEMWSYFGLVEIPPFWRQRIMNISYNVITRVDARRMYELGVVDEVKLDRMYRDMGYSPDDAKLMVQWTKYYAASTEKDLSRADITKAFLDGDLTATEAVDFLRRIGFPEEHANFIIYRADVEATAKARDEKLELIQKKFVANLVSEVDARNAVIGLGFKADKVSEFFDKWRFLREQNTKHPSKTDLDKLIKAQVITQVQYEDTMRKLGYNEMYIKWYTQLLGKAEAK